MPAECLGDAPAVVEFFGEILAPHEQILCAVHVSGVTDEAAPQQRAAQVVERLYLPISIVALAAQAQRRFGMPPRDLGVAVPPRQLARRAEGPRPGAW